MRPRGLESQFSIQSEMELDVIAVIPGVRRWNGRAHGWVFDLANADQLVLENLRFGLDLKFVGDMLVVTTTALGEVSATRTDPLRRGFQDFDQFPAGKAAFFFYQPDADFLARQRKGNKDGSLVFEPSKGFAAVGERFEGYNFQRHSLADG